MAHQCGIRVDNFHADNGVFASAAFEEELRTREQDLRLSGVGAHHQNGRAERAIQTVVWAARSMMIHAHIMWPDAYDAALWPMALTYAAWIYNHTPKRETGLAPMEVFTGTMMSCKYLRRCRVWGCPSFVLDPRLQDRGKIPKWNHRARRGQFMGFSPQHSSTVARVLNPVTGSITPQYHVVLDEKFTTVASDRDIDMTEQYERLFQTSRERYLADHDLERDGPLPPLHDEWCDPQELERRRRQRESNNGHHRVRAHDPDPAGVPPEAKPPDDDDTVDMREGMAADDAAGPVHPVLDLPAPDDADVDDDNAPVDALEDPENEPLQAEAEPTPLRRSHRQQKPNRRFFGDEWVNLVHWRVTPMHADVSFLMSIDWDEPNRTELMDKYSSLLSLSKDPHSGELEDLIPMLLSAKANDADEPSMRDVLNLPDGPERDAWVDAMYSELDALQDKGTFIIVDRETAGERQVVPSTWAFKRKRYPDGTIMKLKARFCVRGDRQWEVINSAEETHSPVVEFGTLRLALSLMLNFDLESMQIDFCNAFVQSDLPRPIFLELPPGIRDNPELDGKILKVFKSLYGDRRCPRLFWKFLKAKLESPSLGFRQSDHDHCLFVKEGAIVVVYVDDAIVLSRDTGELDKFENGLKSEKMDYKREGSLTNYLGIKLQKLDDGSVAMLQRGLIDRILEAMDLQDSGTKETPAADTLGKCPDAPPISGKINYRSVVGMLMFLVGNTRPDCAFATHQCARFSHAPKLPHEVALKRIGRYLQGTKDGGIIMRPSKNVKLDCYVDADFAGLWGKDDSNDNTSVRSRTGFYIVLGNIPVLWCSKLQTEVALSTMEAEYIALSTAMRSFVPLRRVLGDLTTSLGVKVEPDSEISTVFEDNQAALTLATQDPPRMTPRSKHIAVKYHWFRDHLSSTLKVKYVDTVNQLADILTKPLTPLKFSAARRKLMGW
jgi:hypothetical protein